MLIAAIALAVGQTNAAPGSETYLTPPQTIREAALAPYYQNVAPGPISPDGAQFAVLERDGMPPLATLAKAHDNLGGLQVDLLANRNRSLTTRNAKGLQIYDLASGKHIEVHVPQGERVGEPHWSPDSRWIAFFVYSDDATRLYVADASNGESRPACRRPILATLDENFEWTKDDQLCAILLPVHRGAPPVNPLVASTPYLQISDQKGAHLETYPSVLQAPHDEDLLEYYTTGQLAVVNPARGTVAEIGKPAMYRTVSPSPHGKYFIATLLEKPFSYLVPVSNFPERQIILGADGKELVQLEKRPLRTGSPNEPRGNYGGGAANGKRQVEWRSDSDELTYLAGVTANEGDDLQPPAPRHDAVMLWKAPFAAKDASPYYEGAGAITSYTFGADGKSLFITTGAAGGRRGGFARRGAADGNPSDASRTISFVAGPGSKTVRLFTTTAEAMQSANLVTGPDGLVRESADSKSAYVAGEKLFADPYAEAPRPYVDRISLTDGTRERLFESSGKVFEQPTMLDDGAAKLLVTRQSPTTVPQTLLVDRASKHETQLTENRDYLPDVSQARREYVTVTRADGFKFKVKVTLPEFAHKAPALFWIYPSEFTSQEEYDRSKRSFNKNLFTAPAGANKDILIRLGYVVVEPDVPIVGPRGEMNDEYVEMERNSLSATIDDLEARGWIDRSRLAVGGHSYGAFSTANALAHTPFFKCGIAGDGNYLRPLTPYGFQNEQRQLWSARETYLHMSPLLYAEDFTGALLMYHGLEDQNVGTDPINSRRLFDALEELGKPAELVMYPYEDHGQIARETILDQWARFTAWLDKWLNPAADKPAK